MKDYLVVILNLNNLILSNLRRYWSLNSWQLRKNIMLKKVIQFVSKNIFNIIFTFSRLLLLVSMPNQCYVLYQGLFLWYSFWIFCPQMLAIQVSIFPCNSCSEVMSPSNLQQQTSSLSSSLLLKNINTYSYGALY